MTSTFPRPTSPPQRAYLRLFFRRKLANGRATPRAATGRPFRASDNRPRDHRRGEKREPRRGETRPVRFPERQCGEHKTDEREQEQQQSSHGRPPHPENATTSGVTIPAMLWIALTVVLILAVAWFVFVGAGGMDRNPPPRPR